MQTQFPSPKKILGLWAHPDDEILGPGGTFAHYAQQGADIHLVYTTNGEAGEISDPALATRDNLGQVRQAEMRAAANALGVQTLTFLDYRDSGMDGSADNKRPDAYINIPDDEVIARLVAIIRQFQPHVIITFEPYGGYGHPDHIAINKHSHAALHAAAEPTYKPDLGPVWATPRLFYAIVPTSFFFKMRKRMEELELDTSFFEEILTQVDKRWPTDQIHCIINIEATADAKWSAFAAHRTQFGANSLFRKLPQSEMRTLMKEEHFALAHPEPPPNLQLTDLFGAL